MSVDWIEAYPWFLNKPFDLAVNEQLVRTKFNAGEWMDHWRPLLAKLRELWLAAHPRRFLVAIAGPPGAGKSVFTEQLHWLIERGLFHKEAHSVALPMDGFHYPNEYLENHYRKLEDGSYIRLSTVKGQPDTFDIKSFRQHLKLLVGRPEVMQWPGYSRFTHDVVPDKFHVHYSANICLVEGNYILVNRGPFAGIPDIFDLKVYVDAPAPKIIANLMERHMKGGKSLEDAKDWVKRIDLPNARIVESTKHSADLVIQKDADDDLSAVIWREKSLEAPAEGNEPASHAGHDHSHSHSHTPSPPANHP